MISLTVKWQDRWHWWHRMHPSAYAKGTGLRGEPNIYEIYKHKKSGQIRLYSYLNMDGRKLSINGLPAITMRPRGRFGKLYLGFDELEPNVRV